MRTKEEIEAHVLNEETITRLKYIFHTKLKRRNDFDDFYHDYVVHLLEGYGAHQTLDQFAVDWIREKTFFNRRTRTAPSIESLDALINSTGSRFEPENREDGLFTEWYREQVNELVKKYKGRPRIAIYLYFFLGMDMREIALLLDVTESRVSQLFREIKLGKRIGEYLPYKNDDFSKKEMTENEILKEKNKILQTKLTKAFREKLKKV